MNKHYSFPKIRQYYQVLRDLKLRHCYTGKDDEGNPTYDLTRELPTIKFKGFVKLHGTNAAIVFNRDGSHYAQSRENVITEEADNAGFAKWVTINGSEAIKVCGGLNYLFSPLQIKNFVVYGEWCGGSIQKGVALNELPKMFVIFAAKMVFEDGSSEWTNSALISENKSLGIYNITRAPYYEVIVDLNRPDKAIEQMVEIATSIGDECPFCATLGISGIGEGIVFQLEGEYDFETAFKVKDERHSKSKIKKLPSVDVEKMESIHQAVKTHCHEDRLEQGWNAVIKSEEDMQPQKIADFIRWIVNDLWEEESDSIESSGITRKEIGGAVSKKAARWFQEKLKANI
jgi:hypothetical protein